MNNELNSTPVLNYYKNALHFINSLIGKVIKYLKVKGFLESIVIFIMSDHREEFNNNNY
ncbi:MAG: sulfatase-like hydrolase/transferase [Flavobacteriales bacterium AspAUS03]